MEDFKRLYPNVDLTRKYVEDPKELTVLDKNQELADAIYNYIQETPFDWNMIIWSVSWALYGDITDLLYSDEVGVASLERDKSTYLYNNLEQAVTDMFKQGGFGAYGRVHHIVPS